MKKFFKFALVALAVAATFVACKEKEEPVDEPTGKTGWEGNWGVIGDFNGWAGDVAMTATTDGWDEAEVEIAGGTLEFKFRRDATWGDYEYGLPEAGEVELDKEITLKEKGGNLKVPQAGVYKMELQPNKELAKIHYVGEPFVPAVKIDGDLSEWADVEGGTNGNHTFKVKSDERYIYFCSTRTTAGRFSDLWGVEAGYVYFAMDVDGNPENGVTLNSNGPYDMIGFIYCFGGSAENPKVEITAAGGIEPAASCLLDNVKVAGYVDEDGVHFEYSIPREDIIDIPNTPITIESWGNKDCAKVTLTATL